MPQRSWIVAAGGLAALFIPAVHGHIYIVESRQYYNSPVYQDDDFPNLEKNAGAYNAGGQVEVQKRAIRDTEPALLAEYGNGFYPLRWVYDKGEMAPNGNYIEPQGISVRHGVCGDPKSGDQGGKDGENTYSTPNSEWPILQEFTQGQVMEIKAVMKAWHWGHLEFFICDSADLDDPDGVATQECFNMHPLTRAEGDGVNSPIDPNFPGRYYTDPPCRENETEQDYDWRAGGGYVMTMNYKLPEDLVCDHCVLQMWYFTGHKCYHPGYEEFNPPSWGSECAPNKSDWIDLTIPYCGDKEWNLAEEFWACSDIAILADGSTPPTTPTTPSPEEAPVDIPEPTPEPTPSPTPEPVMPVAPPTPEPTPSPTPEPTPAPTPEPGRPVAPPTPEPTPSPTPEPVMPVAPPTREPVMPVAPPTPEPTTATTDPPVDPETAEPTSPMTTEPAAPAPTTDGEPELEYESLGCFHDNRGDRVLGDKLTSHDMTTAVCFDYCTDLGAAFMATQYGMECWCSPDGGLDYNRHYDIVGENAVCDMNCIGDESEFCGGFDSFELYRLAPASTCSTPVEPYEQCGGLEWTGSTCCSDGYECTEMTTEGCYSQCRPVSTGETTPAPTDADPTPSPVSMDEETDPPVMADPEPVTPTPEPTRPPTTPDTPSPVQAPTAPPVAPETPSPVPDTPEPTPARTPAPVTAEPRSPPSTPGTSAPAYMQEMLDWHNDLRCIHNADPLTWDSAVEASAAEQAKRMSDACGGLDHSTKEQRNYWGENIAYCGNGKSDGSCYSAEKMMMDPEYGFYESEVQTNDVTEYGGHATQILWKSSKKLGCATSICASTGRLYLACQYDPAGNYNNMEATEVGLPTNAGNC